MFCTSHIISYLTICQLFFPVSSSCDPEDETFFSIFSMGENPCAPINPHQTLIKKAQNGESDCPGHVKDAGMLGFSFRFAVQEIRRMKHFYSNGPTGKYHKKHHYTKNYHEESVFTTSKKYANYINMHVMQYLNIYSGLALSFGEKRNEFYIKFLLDILVVFSGQK